MPPPQTFDEAWTAFLDLWPLARVRTMTLDEYTNANQSDAYIYWLEKHLDKVGSIWGGSAFKFGIYRRANFESTESSGGRIWGEKYAWQSKFGKTENEAFATVRSRIVEVIEAAQAGNFERIDQIDLANVLKWKIAFHYQDRDHPGVLPIFKKEMLFHHYRAIDPTAKYKDTPQSLLYAALLGRAEKGADVVAIGTALWQKWANDKAVRAWALPVGWLPQAALDALLSATTVASEAVEPSLETLLSNEELAEGDRLVLLVDGDVKAVGTLTAAEPSDHAWTQTLVDIPSGLLVQPTAQMRKLEPAEWAGIQSRLPKGKVDAAKVADSKPHDAIVSPAPEPSDAPPKDPPALEKPTPAQPCDPQNIILYGPPGTGKTYSTVRRALELILGAKSIAGLNDKALTALFRDHQSRGQIEFVTFHQSYGYEEFVEGLRPVLDTAEGGAVRYELHDGAFKRIALRAAAEGLVDGRSAFGGQTVEPLGPERRVQEALDRSSSGAASFAFTAQTRQFVLIIDEINRGNVSKILGELITLLEADKRLGARSELKLPLSYSPGHRFAVPPNLHVLGTMNTADRSIALMDVALRRRFTFEELMPKAAVIREVLGERGLDPGLVELTAELFDTLNHRIRFLYDRDHQLGHAYFLDVASLDGLRRVMVDKVIPLLQEYFYGAWAKICIVLGCPYDEAGRPLRKGHLVEKASGVLGYVAPMVRAEEFGEEATLGFDHDEYENRLDFIVDPGFKVGAIPRENLARTLLGVLDLKAEVHAQRVAALAPHPSATTPATDAESAD
jgi:5-methylcytosine-specific restriction protein B